jgi:hypothetical protein
MTISRLELVAGAGIFSKHYVTGDVQFVDLTEGEITYLGRIEIEDVEFKVKTDGSLGDPIGVKLVFVDALEDDQFAWEQQYKLFQNRVPNPQVVGNWAGRDYVILGRKVWTRTYSTNPSIGYGTGSGKAPSMGSDSGPRE